MDTNGISEETSRRIQILRFPLIFGVIVIHARSFEVGLSAFPSRAEDGWAFAIQWFCSEILARVAVPLFFLFAGYLFFASSPRKAISEKWRQRALTLLWPYFLWNSLLILLQVGGQLLPGGERAFSDHALNLEELSLRRLADLYLGFNQGLANGPLWFLRDLITLSLAAPLYRWGIDRTGGWLLLLPFAVWLGAFGPIFTNFPISAESVTWYGLGLAIASPRVPILDTLFEKADRCSWIVLAIPYLAIGVFEVLAVSSGNPPVVLHKLAYFLAAAMAWKGVGCLESESRSERWLAALAPSAYFVFLAHAPVLQAIKEGLYRLLPPRNAALMLLDYAATAVATAAVLTALYSLLQAKAPRILFFLTGIRSRKD